MNSLWENIPKYSRFESLNQDLKTDVLIIGGGITGISCAYLLHQADVPYALVEAETVCSGITKNTTAKITSQHGLIYSKLIRRLGTERAKQYLQANEAALEQYRKVCGGIDCDFEKKDAYVYSLDSRKKIEKEAEALVQLGFPASFSDSLPLPFPVAGAVKFPNQAQFNPLKFVFSITEGLHIYEHTKVNELAGTTAFTRKGKIKAKKIIIATHFPFINKHGCYFLKMYQHRSYVLALENAQDTGGMYIDAAQKGLSFRNSGNLLLLGGGSHRTGKKGGNWQELRAFARRYYPASTERGH